MSRSDSFRLAMAALAVALIVGMALITPPAPALASCASPADPTTCAGVSAYCAASIDCSPYYFPTLLDCQTYFAYLCIPPSGPGDCTDDGRVNRNCSAPEIVYCDEDQIDFYYYNYDGLKGEFDFSVPTEALLVSVEETILVWQDGAVRVYLNPDGSVALYAPQTDAKTYFLRFDPFQCAPIEEGAEWGL